VGDDAADQAALDGGPDGRAPDGAVGQRDDLGDGPQLSGADPDHPAGELGCDRAPGRIDEDPADFAAHPTAQQLAPQARRGGVVHGGLAGGPQPDPDHGLGHRTEHGERAGDLGLLFQRARRGRIRDDRGGVEEMGGAAGDAGDAPHQVDGVVAGLDQRVRLEQGPVELDHGDVRQPDDGIGHLADRAGPGQAEDVVVGDDLGHQRGGRPAEVTAQRTRVPARGVDDHGVRQPERGLQVRGQADIDRPGVGDLDAHQTAHPGGLQQAGHLEPAQAELAGDLGLGLAVEVVAPGDRGGQHQLSRPGREIHPRPRLLV
jgi:hypothetical protein